MDFYAPTLFDDVNNSGSIYKTIYPAVGASVDCTNAYFGGDPASGVVKVCRVKGFRYYKEGTTFTVQVPTTYTAHQFCHGSYIPRDLGMGLDGNASPTGWCSDFVTKTTYATVTDTAEGTITVERSGGSASSKAVLTCSSGSYIISSGQLSVTSTTGFAGSFCPQYGLFSGLIKQGKSATFYLYGGNGATVGSSTAGTGGYTKGVMVSGKMSSFLKTLYFYVGGNAVGVISVFAMFGFFILMASVIIRQFLDSLREYRMIDYFEKNEPEVYKDIPFRSVKNVAQEGEYTHKVKVEINLPSNGLTTFKQNVKTFNHKIESVQH